jgi:hypothetical protein
LLYRRGGVVQKPIKNLAVLMLLLFIGCNSATNAECLAAGGQCLIGDVQCQGTAGTQQCEAEQSPAGIYCCLPCPSGQTPNDGGSPTTGCH